MAPPMSTALGISVLPEVVEWWWKSRLFLSRVIPEFHSPRDLHSLVEMIVPQAHSQRKLESIPVGCRLPFITRLGIEALYVSTGLFMGAFFF